MSKTRVIKVGGSLLTQPDLASRLGTWLSAQPQAANVLIVGGGAMVDALRELDRTHHLGPRLSHLLAGRIMSVTAQIVAALLPKSDVVSSYRILGERLATERGQADPATLILDPAHFLEHEEPALPGTSLPWSWEATSDSIAARVAALVRADELVLLKSCLPNSTSAGALDAPAEYVDAFFTTAARELPCVRCVDLRKEQAAEVTISRGS